MLAFFTSQAIYSRHNNGISKCKAMKWSWIEIAIILKRKKIMDNGSSLSERALNSDCRCFQDFWSAETTFYTFLMGGRLFLEKFQAFFFVLFCFFRTHPGVRDAYSDKSGCPGKTFERISTADTENNWSRSSRIGLFPLFEGFDILAVFILKTKLLSLFVHRQHTKDMHLLVILPDVFGNQVLKMQTTVDQMSGNHH